MFEIQNLLLYFSTGAAKLKKHYNVNDHSNSKESYAAS